MCNTELGRLALVQIFQLDRIIMNNIICATRSLGATTKEREAVTIIAGQILLNSLHSVLVVHLTFLRVGKNLVSGRDFFELYNECKKIRVLYLHHHHDQDGF